LDINPSKGKVIRLAGDENSFFTSCTPYSDAQLFEEDDALDLDLHWLRKKKVSYGEKWETLGTHPHDR